MKANEVKRVYVIYNQRTDIDENVSEDLADTLIECGKLVDYDRDSECTVYVYDNMTKEEYNTTVTDFTADYSVMEFIAKFSIFSRIDDSNDPQDPDNTVWDPTPYHNLDEKEQIEVLHFISDDMLIDELLRRVKEYRKATDKAYDALESMLIYK